MDVVMNKPCLCLIAFAFATPAQAQENCGYPSSVLKSGFEAGEQPSVVTLPLESAPVTVSLQFPAANITVQSDTIQVYGSYTGPANTGITVNDVRALSNGVNFTSPLIRLVPGPNTITLKATTLDLAPLVINRIVTYDNAQPAPVTFTGMSPGDYAPIRIPYAVTYVIPAGQTALTRAQFDLDGDGTFELDSPSLPSNLRFDFDSPGFYLAATRLSFDDGNPGTSLVVNQGNAAVLVQSLNFTRQTLCGVYYGMKSRLNSTQISLALNTLDPALRPTFQALWTELGTNLPTVAGRLGEIIDGQISDVAAEVMTAVADTPGEFLGYPIQLRRGSDGVWRISGM
jgi:hypothetical protein